MTGERDRKTAVERERSYVFLRSSKLTIFDEYKRMLRDIHGHLEEEKRSSYGGRKKRENDMRPFLYDSDDTYEKPFFSVLIKMLLEVVSLKSSQRQLEDLQRVYQWYITNRTKLCKSNKTFGKGKGKSRPLTYRPSSSIDPGGRSGILRHVISTNDSVRATRPQTSHISLERSRTHSTLITRTNEEAVQKALLNIEGCAGVVPPDIPHDLADFVTSSLAGQQQTVKRPDTAPSHIVVDRTSKVERSLAKPKEGESTENKDVQLPISKVSIRYNAPSDKKQPDQANRHEQNSEIVRVHEVVRCKSEDSLRQLKEVRVEKEIYDYISEIDEDRVIVDVDQIVKDAEVEDYKDTESVEQLSKIVGEKVSDVDGACQICLNRNSEQEIGNPTEQQADMQFEGNRGKNTVEERPQVEYIPSYSKFQKLKERKKAVLSDDSDVDNSRNTASSNSIHQTVAKKPIDRQSGLTRQGLTSNAVLEMVTPIGQQMMEQKAPMQILTEYRKEARSSPSGSPHNSPRDRLSPRLHLRSNTGLKHDLSNQKLKKAEILFPEESPRMYKVHFPQEKPVKTEKHYKVSGPVEPDSVRYQYKHDAFGNKTYLKKLTRPYNCNRSDSVKTRSQFTSPQAVYQNKDPRTMNTKALASSMIIKHLGASDRRSSDRMTGHSGAYPVWVVSQDAEHSDTTDYVKFTKSFEKDTVSSNWPSESKRPLYHIRQFAVELPEKAHSVGSSNDSKGRYVDGEPGINSHGTLPVYHLANENIQGDELDARRTEWLNQYNGGYFPLKAEGHALQVEERSAQSLKATQPTTTQIQAKVPNSSRPSSRQMENIITAPPMQNLSRPVSACSHSSSRLGSANSKRSSRSRSRSRTKEAVDGIFVVNDFSHYCFGDNPALEEDYQLQRKTNAAVDIQRIFRGYMARKYARDLKILEKERQKRAAIKIQSSMRGYLARKRLMEERLSQRAPQINVDDWEKQYKGHLKKKINERTMKAQARSREFAKLQVKQEERVRKVSASKDIYDIFHDKGPTKAQIKAAAITIQRYVRGWLVRKFYQKAKEKAMKRTLNFNGFLKSYMAHIERIMERHGVKDPKAVLAFNELLEYIESRNKYEVEYDRILNGKAKSQDRVFTYEDIKKFFEACGHYPSRKEIEDSISVALKDVMEMKQHNYTKAQIVEIAFQIYVPKGTKLTSTRKSTWMNPLVDGDEAAMIKLSKKINESTNLEKVFEFISASKRDQVEMKERSITPDLLPLDAKLNGFEKPKDIPVRKVSQVKKSK